MSQQQECRWEWTKPDKPGLWWWGGENGASPRMPNNLSALMDEDDIQLVRQGWWAYIGALPPEPLPPKTKVTQTLWMVRSGPNIELFYKQWFSPDDTIPPGAIETNQTREVEL